MKTNQKTITVNGTTYTTHSDFILRATLATNPAGITKILRSGGYLSNERSIKKAIKLVFGEEA